MNVDESAARRPYSYQLRYLYEAKFGKDPRMGETILSLTLKKLAPRVKYRLHKPVIENVVFRFHYMATVTLFIAFVLLVCATEYFGDYMKCTAGSAVNDKVLETYCYFMGSFSVDKYFDKDIVDTGAHPGVGSYVETDELSPHRYYQWVPFVLFFQCICFYMPHYIWKTKEGGRLKTLVEGLQFATLARDVEVKCKTGTIPSKDAIDKKMAIVKRDVLLRLRLTKTWSIWLVAMEILNLIHIILEIYFIDRLLNKKFISLGFNVMNFKDDWSGAVNPLNTVFPQMAKCNFYKFGPSGSMMNLDALCVMSMNVLYERIYIVMWFWFLFLLIISALAVVWRITSFILYHYSLFFSELMFRYANSAKLDRRTVMHVVNSCHFGDWLFLYYLGKNMKSSVFKELFVQLAEELQKGELDELEDSQCLKPSEKEFIDAYPSLGFNDEMLNKGEKKSF